MKLKILFVVFVTFLIIACAGTPDTKIHEDMERDKWLNAKEAVDYGIVDKIITSLK